MTSEPEPNAGGHCCACMAHNIGHLYEIYRPANLIGRFDQGRYRSDFSCPLSKESGATNLQMKGPLSYIGGKNRIANQIIEVFPEHTTYVEAFAGGAQVLFHKDPSRAEVLNDLDGEVVNFFRVCQSHHEELLRCLRFILVSRRTFTWLKSTNPESLTDIHRAARF